MNLPLKKLSPEAKLPTRDHPGDAGLDLYALEGSDIFPGQRVLLKTGVAMAIPEGYVGLIWDKSGLAAKQGLTCLGGVVDAGYRGEVLVILANLGTEVYTVSKHQKIAQMLIQKIELPRVEEVFDLDDTERGKGGFGSTGTH